MAVPALKDEKVDASLFEEAVRVGELSAAQANRYMTVNRTLTDAIEHTMLLLKSGRIDMARERLRRAMLAASKLLE